MAATPFVVHGARAVVREVRGHRESTLLGTVVLLFQALLLAHGGLTTLGANAFAFAVVRPWAGYGAYRLVRALGGGLRPGVFVGLLLADLATYVTTALQLASAFPDADAGLAGPAVKFLGVFAFTQIPLAVREGMLGVLLFPGADRQRPAGARAAR